MYQELEVRKELLATLLAIESPFARLMCNFHRCRCHGRCFWCFCPFCLTFVTFKVAFQAGCSWKAHLALSTFVFVYDDWKPLNKFALVTNVF